MVLSLLAPSVPNVLNCVLVMAGPFCFIGIDMVRLLFLPSLASHDAISLIRVQITSAGSRVSFYLLDSAASTSSSAFHSQDMAFFPIHWQLASLLHSLWISSWTPGSLGSNRDVCGEI